jgi:arylamine N-acetyltransferase
MVDVAFGGDGAVKPLPLIDGHITQNIGTQQLRLVYDNIEQQFDKKQKFWIYQYRNNPNLPWNSFYHFSETEFIKEDFGVMSYYTSTNTESFLLYATIVVKFLRKDNEISGKVMLANHEVKQNTGGRTRVIKTCKTEQDRIDALKEYFGITLTADEQRGIRGLPSELSQD